MASRRARKDATKAERRAIAEAEQAERTRLEQIRAETRRRHAAAVDAAIDRVSTPIEGPGQFHFNAPPVRPVETIVLRSPLLPEGQVSMAADPINRQAVHDLVDYVLDLSHRRKTTLEIATHPVVEPDVADTIAWAYQSPMVPAT